jgi:hypothetical protein
MKSGISDDGFCRQRGFEVSDVQNLFDLEFGVGLRWRANFN